VIGPIVPDLVHPGGVAERRRAAVGPQRLALQLVQDADARCTPRGAVIGEESIRDGVGAEASDQPAAVGGGAAPLDILTAYRLDVAPRLAGAGLAPAGFVDVDLGGRGGGQPVAVEAGGAGTPAVGEPNGPPRVAQSREPHQDEVGGVVAAGRLVAVLEIGLVAVGAVGDEDPLRAHQAVCVGVVDRGGGGPEPG
jgi:hypothetical protein